MASLVYSNNASNARSLAQEAVSWYLDHLNIRQPHAANVRDYLRGPVIALTAATLSIDATSSIDDSVSTKTNQASTALPETAPLNWRDYLNQQGIGGLEESLTLEELFAPTTIDEKYAALSPRAKARLEAFLEGVALAVTSEETNGSSVLLKTKRSEKSGTGISLLEGLVGFRSVNFSNVASRSDSGVTKGEASPATKSQQQAYQQLGEFELVSRLELYLRLVGLAASLKGYCVIAHEPLKALKARARSLVAAFVDTVGTVRRVNKILTRLLTVLTKELLAVTTLSEDLCRGIRNIVSGYVHATSFASLAFLSSPESSAEQRLTPAILKYLLYLQKNWEKCEADCQLELMLSKVLNPSMRHMFKTAEFQSIGHLLEVYQGYRDELHNIELPPRFTDRTMNSEDERIGQAIKDLQREVIAVNGTILPHVTNRSDLVQLLVTALSARTLFDPRSRRRRDRKKRIASPARRDGDDTEDDEYHSSGNEADFGETSASESEKSPGRRRSTFRLSTVDLLTKRLLLAASRTGTGGDAYFVVRDLFGGEDVEVVPSQYQPGAVRPATIDLLVRLASVTIKSHSCFNIYPKSMVGETEPLIQIHATTTETIALQEVRATDNADSSDGMAVAELILQERPTEKGGYRYLSIRPALYEKVSVWGTPS
jgi:hypothetical protein